MWVCLNDAFFSIVHKDCARDEVLVRARRPGDIEKVFPGVSVRRDVHADYLYRAVVKRKALAETLVGESSRVTYPNFKDSVTDARLHAAYLRVWAALAELQQHRGAALAAPVFKRIHRVERPPLDIDLVAYANAVGRRQKKKGKRR